MITLITGPKTINLKKIARSVLDIEKTWSFKDYTVKYKDDKFVVFDVHKNNVFCNNEDLGELNESILKNSDANSIQENIKFLEEIHYFNYDVNDILNNKNHFQVSWPTMSIDNFFLGLNVNGIKNLDDVTNLQNMNSDFGDLMTMNGNAFKNIVIENISDYEKILNSFKEDSTHAIWTGIFSPSFIERVRNDLGSENVRVLNFIRNPSVCYFVSSYYEAPDITRKHNCDRYVLFSILNMMMVKNLPNVINIRYEDYLKNGKFSLMEKDVPLRFELTNYNNIINQFEFSGYKEDSIDDDYMNDFNQNFQNFDLIKNLKTVFETEEGSEYYDVNKKYMYVLEKYLNIEEFNKIPKNFFENLNYNPLNISQIISR